MSASSAVSFSNRLVGCVAVNLQSHFAGAVADRCFGVDGAIIKQLGGGAVGCFGSFGLGG